MKLLKGLLLRVLVWSAIKLGGEAEMAVVYATLIIKGVKTLDQVPEKIRGDVQGILEALEVEF